MYSLQENRVRTENILQDENLRYNHSFYRSAHLQLYHRQPEQKLALSAARHRHTASYDSTAAPNAHCPSYLAQKEAVTGRDAGERTQRGGVRNLLLIISPPPLN